VYGPPYTKQEEREFNSRNSPDKFELVNCAPMKVEEIAEGVAIRRNERL
jgi:hypothetical protein